MTKQEAIAYLRKKQLLERLTDKQIPDSRQNSEEALREMETSPESEKKDLTTDLSSV